MIHSAWYAANSFILWENVMIIIKFVNSSLKCTKCDQMFDKLHTYHGHVNICDGLDKFKCSGCGLCFVDKKKSYNHMYNCRKKLTCKRCSLPFCNWKSLLNHCKIVHPEIECKICGSFFYIWDLIWAAHKKVSQYLSKLCDTYIFVYYMSSSGSKFNLTVLSYRQMYETMGKIH